jgi:hypothetical protein
MVEIDEVTLAKALRAIGICVPGDSTLYMTVPGGGDWSHSDIEVGRESALFLEYTEQTEDEETEVCEP